MVKHINNKILGDKGENIAVNFLKEKNYVIIETNWRHGKGEIDIICEKDKTIIFIEVKTRSTRFFGEPELSVTEKKKKTIAQTAEAYLVSKNLIKECRFDIISIVVDNDVVKEIFHIEDAFFVTKF